MDLLILLLWIGFGLYAIKSIDTFADDINPYDFSKRK